MNDDKISKMLEGSVRRIPSPPPVTEVLPNGQTVTYSHIESLSGEWMVVSSLATPKMQELMYIARPRVPQQKTMTVEDFRLQEEWLRGISSPLPEEDRDLPRDLIDSLQSLEKEEGQ